MQEYNGSSWDSESLDPYSVIHLKHSGSIQMYLAKFSGQVYIGVEYGVFGKFRFMTQVAYDALDRYDEDTIYFVRISSMTHNFHIYFLYSITNLIIFIIVALILYLSKINILYVN